MMLMKRKYWKTFWSTATGVEFTEKQFLSAKTDAMKAQVVGHNKMQLRRIRNSVKEWTLAGWWRWKEEQPVWFTEKWKKNLPDDMLPQEALIDMKKSGGGRSRRNSLFDVVGIGAKEEDKKCSEENEKDDIILKRSKVFPLDSKK